MLKFPPKQVTAAHLNFMNACATEHILWFRSRKYIKHNRRKKSIYSLCCKDYVRTKNARKSKTTER